ncbi:nucleotidyltransferase domain-containing protein [Fibrella sp. HMF5335]|uniref:Nucleotidyltransferase domain-containing protein n=1 Tax=Fibrella rubiginis TaxID=2817060 RepID=A0A939K3C8_9BACT|nr:nucleotidyltransferase domain-containing protein [Fibrella rubiginis]MBO0939112.1 nucleotidyltransferase domain-containing protein [Fibrella rubiginis]
MTISISDFQTLQAYLREHNIFGRFGLSRIGVFGSFVRGEQFRDIDLLIDDDIPYKQLIALRDELQTDLTVPVDLMIRRYAEPIILRSALRDIQYAVNA